MRIRATHLPASFWRLWWVVVTARAAQFVEAFLPLLLLVTLGATPATVAVVLLLQQAASTVGFAAVGRASARYGLVNVLRCGLAGATVATGLLAVGTTSPVVAFAAAAFGAFSALWRAAVQALIPASLVSLEVPAAAEKFSVAAAVSVRTRAFGALFWAANLGAVLSAGAAAAGAPLRWLLATQTALTGLAFALTWLLPQMGTDEGRLTPMPESHRPGPAKRRRARADVRWLAVAFAPATMLMFQAFSGLAVALPEGEYRLMVLFNAALLVTAQPLLNLVLQRLSVTVTTVAAISALAIGMGAHAANPADPGWTVVWTLGELVVVVVPGALIGAATPVAEAARHVGWFQVTQGVAAGIGLYLGPLLADRGTVAFTWWCAGLGVLGIAAVLTGRRVMTLSWKQPVSCPCGALFCACGGVDTGCASLSPALIHRLEAAPVPDRST